MTQFVEGLPQLDNLFAVQLNDGLQLLEFEPRYVHSGFASTFAPVGRASLGHR